MSVKYEASELENGSAWKVVIADDDHSVHEITRMVAKKIHLDGRDIDFLNAYSVEDTKRILMQEDDVALILLDVVMDDDNSGLELVKWIREDLKNDRIRIVLRTGHPGSAPESEIIYRYEINDYKEKTELNHTKLNTAIISALRNYRDIMHVEKLNRELRAANEELEGVSMGKTNFLTRLSHELRTPLNGIVVTTNLLKMTPLNLEQMEYVDILLASSQRMIPLIDEMLDVTQLESGVYQLTEERFSLKALVDALQGKYAAKASEKHLNCHFKVSDDLPDYIYGDRRHLEEILTHLLDNSIKFTDEGFIGLEIRKNEETQARVALEFLVTDTGTGIPKEDKQKIFDPFYLSHKEGTYQTTGLGLGLTIVKKLIELMNGNIWIDFNYSKGVQFVFTLEMLKEKP